jgi:hypothetical protein
LSILSELKCLGDSRVPINWGLDYSEYFLFSFIYSLTGMVKYYEHLNNNVLKEKMVDEEKNA